MTNPSPTPPQQPSNNDSVLKGVKVLLEGPTGTGKTHSLGTLVDTGLEVFYLGIDSGREALWGTTVTGVSPYLETSTGMIWRLQTGISSP